LKIFLSFNPESGNYGATLFEGDLEI